MPRALAAFTAFDDAAGRMVGEGSVKRLALLVLLSLSPVTSMAAPCPEEMQPEGWGMTLRLIDHAAKTGPVALAKAAAALREGKREEAIGFLDQVAGIPTDEAIASGSVNLMYAVLDARLASDMLRGCPD